ncbi:MAG TPA: glycosyltransferase family 4 protein [Verrucomicrobiae bacterium]|nr:glycosyltransferase family 4 protein [Verrucomicrobiae bacterium]
MKVALITTDGRDQIGEEKELMPSIGPAPLALLRGFANCPKAEIHVISCAQQRMRSLEKLADNIFFHSLHVPKIGWMRTVYQGCIRATRKKLKEIQPEIVHGQGTERDCAISAVLSGFPNVVTIHGNMAELARLFGARVGGYAWLAARLENFTLRRTAGVFCNSKYTESLMPARAKKTWLVPNALRREFFEAIPVAPRRSVLLNVGVITERKRQVELLGVAQNLQRQGLKFEFHFIGQINPVEPYAAAFLERLKPLEAIGCARHIGLLPTDALIRCFDSASGLVHFPSEEAFGLVVAEALARGLKFFGAHVGGIADIAGDAPGAELFAKDDWAGLTEAIAQWIKEGYQRPIGAAVLMQERYHPDKIARRHLEIYREVTGRTVDDD